MARKTDLEWTVPPLSNEDQKLVEAYVETGRALDDLAYTKEFDKLCNLAGLEPTDDHRKRIYKRLLTLRKMGRLPRIYAGASKAG